MFEFFNRLSASSLNFKSASSQLYECRESLVDVIQRQIIPRLVNSQQFAATSGNDSGFDTLIDCQPDVQAFSDYCIRAESGQANALVDKLIERGLSTEGIFLELITPAARHLGVMWEQDLCDFTQVTCGLALMHQITYRIGFEFQNGPHESGGIQRVMLACAPGSQHFLGLTIVADIFRKSGSEVVLEISSTETELLHAVANEWFDVIGISVAIEAQLATLPELVRKLRASSGNPKVRIVLGGPIFLLKELRAEQLSADAISTDAREAVVVVRQLVGSNP